MMVSVANKLTQGSRIDSGLTHPEAIEGRRLEKDLSVAVVKIEKIAKCEEWSGVTT